MIVILGAGVTGLAAASELLERKAPYLLLERESEPGGLCRSRRVDGFTFDMSGHFLHLSGPPGAGLPASFDPRILRPVTRDARVRIGRTETPYPFQAHLRGHPARLVRAILRDFAACRIAEATGDRREPRHFREWLLGTFGEAMCRAFFFPYNAKMWRAPLEEMDCAWARWAVPVPRFEDLLAGLRGDAARTTYGYNARFYYPREGGMGTLVARMAAPHASRIRVGARAAGIRLRRREVLLEDGTRIPYRRLVSTAPLTDLAAMTAGLPSEARAAARALRWNRVLTINWGVRGSPGDAGHWTYLPGAAFPMFRVGVLSNVFPGAAPPGHASLFTDRSFLPGEPIDLGREVRVTRAALVRLGLIGRARDASVVAPLVLDPAYAIPGTRTRRAREVLGTAFARHGVVLAGRYGAWDYFGMERSMRDGVRAAEAAIGQD